MAKQIFRYKYLVLTYFLLISTLCYCQKNTELIEFQPEASEYFLKIDSISVLKGFLINESTILYFVRCNKLYSSGLGLILYNKTDKKILFQEHNEGDEDFIKPHFFKTDKANGQILLLCNVGADFSYGIWAYQIANNNIKKIGILDISLNVDIYKEYDDPIPYAKIVTDETSIFITFIRSVASNWQNGNETIYQPGEISFIINNGNIQTIKK